MATGRMLNKKIGENKDVDNLSSDTSRLAFSWTIPHLDRDGRVHGDPFILKNKIFPRRKDITEKDMEGFIQEWVREKLVIWYEADGDKWLQFPSFRNNQPNLRYERETPSSIPPSEEGRIITGSTPAESRQDAGSTPQPPRIDSATAADRLPPNSMEVKLIEENRTSKKSPVNVPKISNNDRYTQTFIDFWNSYPRKIGKIAAWRKWKATLKKKGAFDGYENDGEACLVVASMYYAEQVKEKKTEPEYIKLPATFLGPDEHWRDMLEGTKYGPH